jgi:DNA-binding XRE family transcriptional regulator
VIQIARLCATKAAIPSCRQEPAAQAHFSLHMVCVRTPSEVFGDNLRRVRLQRGLTQRELAAAAKMSMKFLGLVERGQQPPNLIAVYNMARAMGVPVAALVEDFDPKQPSAATERQPAN